MAGYDLLRASDIAPLAYPLPRRSSIATWAMCPPNYLGGAGFDLTGQGTTTWLDVIPCPSLFYAVRFIYGNIDPTTTNSLTGIAFCPSSSANDYANPTGGGSWSWATWINGGVIGPQPYAGCFGALPTAGGSGYAVNDTITIAGGSLAPGVSAAVLRVTTVSSGAITGVTVVSCGQYSAIPTNPVAQGTTSGAGTGATFNLYFSQTDFELPRDPGASRATAAGFPATIPVNTAAAFSSSARVPKLVASDWSFCPSIAPTSGPAKYLFVRTMGPGQVWKGTVQTGTSGYWNNAAVNQGYDWAAKSLAGDFVTSPANVIGSPPAGHTTAHPLLAVQFMVPGDAINVMCIGDSHFSGQTTSQGVNGFLTQACWALSTQLGIPVMPVNAAWSGADSDTFWPTFNNYLAFAKPSVVFIQGWSANDSITTEAKATRYFARMLAAAQRVRDQGGVPIFVTPFPRDAATMTGNTLVYWLYLRNRLLAASQAYGIAVIDAGAALGSTTTATYSAGMSTDTVHPNDAGHATVAGLAKTVLLQVLGAVPRVAA